MFTAYHHKSFYFHHRKRSENTTKNLNKNIVRACLLGLITIFFCENAAANCTVYLLDTAPTARSLNVDEKYLIDLSQNQNFNAAIKRRGYALSSQKLIIGKKPPRLNHNDIFLSFGNISFADLKLESSSIGNSSAINFELLAINNDLNRENGTKISGTTSTQVEMGAWIEDFTSAIHQTHKKLDSMGWAALTMIGILKSYKVEYFLNNLPEPVLNEIFSKLPKCSKYADSATPGDTESAVPAY